MENIASNRSSIIMRGPLPSNKSVCHNTQLITTAQPSWTSITQVEYRNSPFLTHAFFIPPSLTNSTLDPVLFWTISELLSTTKKSLFFILMFPDFHSSLVECHSLMFSLCCFPVSLLRDMIYQTRFEWRFICQLRHLPSSTAVSIVVYAWSGDKPRMVKYPDVPGSLTRTAGQWYRNLFTCV
jgi:hypothetical protein